jgi:hypothetical protein
MATQRMTVGGKMMYRDGNSERMSTSRDKPSTKKKGADGAVCWEGYRYAGTENGKDKCVKMKK